MRLFCRLPHSCPLAGFRHPITQRGWKEFIPVAVLDSHSRPYSVAECTLVAVHLPSSQVIHPLTVYIFIPLIDLLASRCQHRRQLPMDRPLSLPCPTNILPRVIARASAHPSNSPPSPSATSVGMRKSRPFSQDLSCPASLILIVPFLSATLYDLMMGPPATPGPDVPSIREKPVKRVTLHAPNRRKYTPNRKYGKPKKTQIDTVPVIDCSPSTEELEPAPYSDRVALRSWLRRWSSAGYLPAWITALIYAMHRLALGVSVVDSVIFLPSFSFKLQVPGAVRSIILLGLLN
ncbi:uncharacterized protein BDW47DRAFT_52298 [Aspergillus candidus]|uniref:Uncharacterized protein n=1 Tax=Aspergillus candidus TaxID=41067 RepID=A0A2I2F6F7_ASPCN|nr:hypothetical protein BDW47DRAFT_52298 [Aspergillus candidus]PLB36229.1 hypothetical protein BDW47DRAFT_52298 [Aspergillus candidus]